MPSHAAIKFNPRSNSNTSLTFLSHSPYGRTRFERKASPCFSLRGEILLLVAGLITLMALVALPAINQSSEVMQDAETAYLLYARGIR